MPEYTRKELLQEALNWIALALRADTRRDAWRRYNTAKSLASKAGADIDPYSKSDWPPYSLAKRYLELFLKYLEQEGNNL